MATSAADPRPARDADDVTAILPLRRYHPRHLAAALDSLFAQTDPAWRLVVVVEPEDVERFRAVLAPRLSDARVRLVPNDGGRYPGAFNTGMRRAETAFVAIILGDDMWAPTAVETLRREIRAHPDVDFFHTGRQVVDGDGRPIGTPFKPRQVVRPEHFVWGTAVKHLLCWRRRLGLDVGGVDERLRTAGPDDYDFPWTMAERGATFRAIDETLYIYRDHRDAFRQTTHLPRSVHLADLRYILDKHGVPPADRRERLRRAKRGFLKQCLYRNAAHRWLLTVLRHDPQRGWRQPYR
ncbi:MAG: glycosyltransferase family 2 protein [Candidatus Rokuibacteriota bacterium]